MAQYVKIPDGRRVKFPDGMSKEDMSAAIIRNFPEFAPKQAPVEQPREPAWQPMRDRPISDPDSLLKRGVAAAMPTVRPVVEGVTAGLGGVVGSPLGPAGSVGGGALGYGIGAKASDILEQWAGDPSREQPTTVPGQLLQSAKDIRTGAAYEMGGAALSTLVAPVFRAGKQLTKSGYESILNKVRKIYPAVSEESIKAKAGQIIAENTGDLAQFAANNEVSQEVLEEIPGLKATIGEMTGDPGLIKLQRGLEAQPGEAAQMALEARASNRQAISDYLEKQFPGAQNIDDVAEAIANQKMTLAEGTRIAETSSQAAAMELPQVAPQTTGRRITEEIAEAKAPVVAKERELWEQIPDYELPTTSTDQAFKEATTKPSTARELAQKIDRVYQEMPKTVEGLQAIDRELGSAMASPSATNTERMVLGKIKSAIEADFNAMGEAAQKFDIGVYEGSVIYPEKLEAELSDVAGRIAKEGAPKPPEPNYEQIFKELSEAKIPAIMRQKGEGQAGWHKRIASQYERSIGDLPMMQTTEPSHITTMKKRAAALEKTIAEAEPAVDVGEKYWRAKQYSKTQKFDRFDKGAVKEIAKRGDFFGGKKIPPGKIPEKFMDVDNADQLILAIGKDKAGDVMLGHYADDMMKTVINPQTGEINGKPLARWVRNNRPVLERYGIKNRFSTLENATKTLEAARMAEKRFEKSIAAKVLNADPDKALSAAFTGGEGVSAKNSGEIMRRLSEPLKGNKQATIGLENAFKDFMVDNIETTAKTLKGDQILSPAKGFSMLKKYEPAMRVLYKESPEKYKALKTVQKAMEMGSRSASSPLRGGSDTAEKAGVAATLFVNMISKAKGVPIAGAGIKLAEVGLGAIQKMAAKDVNNLVIRALYDPDLAKILIDATTKKQPKITQKKLANYLATAGLAITKPEEMATK